MFFAGEIFENLPYYTCWSRKNEEKLLPSLKIAKSNLVTKIPEAFNLSLKFTGYDSPIECPKEAEYNKNPVFSSIWTNIASGL